MFIRRSFVLVMTLCLLVLLATTGASLCVTSAVEATACATTAASLEHELAARSLIRCIPELRRHRFQSNNHGISPIGEYYAITIGRCAVKCIVQSERTKFQLRGEKSLDETGRALTRLAIDNNLPTEHVKLRPTFPESVRKDLGTFVWFDQVIETFDLGEVLPWRSPGSVPRPESTRKTWSDVVTFWSSAEGEVLSLEIETRIGNSVRVWYVIVELGSAGTKVLHWGSAT